MAVVKIIEVMGISTKSWEDAADEAVKEAATTIRGITGIDVKKSDREGLRRQDL